LSLAVCIPVTVRTSCCCGLKRLEGRTFKRGASRSFLGVGLLAWDVLGGAEVGFAMQNSKISE
jgi:hypothetical protein